MARGHGQAWARCSPDAQQHGLLHAQKRHDPWQAQAQARESRAATPRGHGLGVHFADKPRVAVSGFFKNYLRARDAAVSRAPGRHAARVGDGAPRRHSHLSTTATGGHSGGRARGGTRVSSAGRLAKDQGRNPPKRQWRGGGDFVFKTEHGTRQRVSDTHTHTHTHINRTLRPPPPCPRPPRPRAFASLQRSS